MVKCPYLSYTKSRSCQACTGYHCTALGRKKKLSDTSVCSNEEEWPECPRYLEAHPLPEEEVIELPPTEEATSASEVYMEAPTVVPAPTRKVVVPPPPPNPDCPYLGPIPDGEKACCGYWCYAKGDPLRVVKRCKSPPSWRECQRLMKAIRNGVKYAGA